METRSVTTAVVAGHLGNPPQYGSTAEEVLATCALVAAADEQWDEKQVSRFQKQVGIHEKVWGRLLSIHRSDRWKQVDLADLPGSYTTLYALATFEEKGWNELVARKLLTSVLTSRWLLQWRKREKLRAEGFQQQFNLILAAPSDKSISEILAVQDELQTVAAKYNMQIIPLSSIPPEVTPQESAKVIATQLLPLLERLVGDAGKVLKESLQIETSDDLLNATMRDFLKFINRTAGSNSAALAAYGNEYILKLALEYNNPLTSRANRFNYKKKLEDLSCSEPGSHIAHNASLIIKTFIA